MSTPFPNGKESRVTLQIQSRYNVIFTSVPKKKRITLSQNTTNTFTYYIWSTEKKKHMTIFHVHKAKICVKNFSLVELQSDIYFLAEYTQIYIYKVIFNLNIFYHFIPFTNLLFKYIIIMVNNIRRSLTETRSKKYINLIFFYNKSINNK